VTSGLDPSRFQLSIDRNVSMPTFSVNELQSTTVSQAEPTASPDLKLPRSPEVENIPAQLNTVQVPGTLSLTRQGFVINLLCTNYDIIVFAKANDFC
jgi:hypothetical protein